MDQEIIYSMLLGIAGGLVRALVGLGKYFEENKEGGKMKWDYLAYTLFVSAAVGAMSGVLADGDWELALLAGYAGTDFIESLYKIKKAQKLKI